MLCLKNIYLALNVNTCLVEVHITINSKNQTPMPVKIIINM